MRMLGFALAILLVCTGMAFAQTLAWEAVTTWDDGTPIGPDELSALRYRIYIGDSRTALQKAQEGIATTSTPAASVPGLVRGKYIAVTAYLPGGESTFSNVVRFQAPDTPRSLGVTK